MKHVTILALKGSMINSIDVTQNIFNRVNEFLHDQGKKPFCTIELVGFSKKVESSNKQFTIHTDKLINEIQNTDLIIIPMICGNFKQIIKNNKEFIPWIYEHYKRNAEIASLCTGVFLLAATGLLKKRNCAVHWAVFNEFREMFPEAKPVDSKIITDEAGIYTCGGSFSYLNLVLYLIEKFVDRKMAVFMSKMFEIEINRQDQAPYIIFAGQKNHKDLSVMKVQNYLEKNYTKKITLDEMSTYAGVGRRSLERRFKKATYNTVSEYLQRIKVEAAKKGIETSRKNISDIMVEVGYSDVKAFRDVFKKYTGLTPVDYRTKYYKESKSF